MRLYRRQNVNRRDFLKIAGATAGALALGSCEPVNEGDNAFTDDITLGPSERVAEDIQHFHFPHFVAHPNTGLLYTYFIDHSGDFDNEVGLATTSDGLNFNYRGKTLQRDEWYDLYQASFASVHVTGGVWYMLYEGKDLYSDMNTVCLATSSNGENWEKQGPIIRPYGVGALTLGTSMPNPGGLGDADVGTPTFFYENGLWHVYFHMTDADEWKVRIGYAYGSDLTALTVSQQALINVQDGFYNGTAGYRSNIIYKNGWYYMAYEISSHPAITLDFADAWWGTTIAKSRTPGDNWRIWEKGPLLQNPVTGYGYDGPELLDIDGSLYLYYRVSDPDNITYRTKLSGL